jgi:MFS family permease
LRVTSGNFLEMFDFFLFRFYAFHIAKAFFPASNEFGSLLLTFMTFGVGFLMRPLGAIVLGAYIDRVGRQLGLIVTLSIMAIGTVAIAFMPTYTTIGLFAPFFALIGHLLQGFSAGVELGGVSVYLSEIAPKPEGLPRLANGDGEFPSSSARSLSRLSSSFAARWRKHKPFSPVLIVRAQQRSFSRLRSIGKSCSPACCSS